MAQAKRDVRPDRIDLRDRIYEPPLVSLPAEYPCAADIEDFLPAYRRAGLILDQGTEGACTGFGLAATVNYLLWRRGLDADEDAVRVSPRMFYQLARVYDEWPGEDYEGSSCRGAMKGWHRHGVCAETLWPYWIERGGRVVAEYVQPREGWVADAARRPLGAYYRINKDSVADMQAAINEVGAIYVSAQVHSGWNLASSTTLPRIKYPRKNNGGHAFAIVGYNEEGFIVQNSWSESWGFHGFAVMTYRDWARNGMDAWVAVLGAPVALDQTIAAHSSHSLREVANEQASFFWRGDANEERESLASGPTLPWDTATAYQHTIVLGNDGRALNRLIENQHAADSVKAVAHDNPAAWLSNKASKKLVIYAHGGLNDEDASIARIRVLAPYFKANGAYPLFVTWKTGMLESLHGMLEDTLKSGFGSARAQWSIDETLEAMKQKLADAKNRTIELAAEKLLVKGIWAQMKQNAGASVLHKAGGALLVDELAKLRAAMPDLEVHLVGHSAGSIIHGHLITACGEAGLPVTSCTLFAPACTLEFALQHYVSATDNGVLPKASITIENLNDERELADSVGPYGKSLLYLVSRALEVVHKKPLLGMEVAWRNFKGGMSFEHGVSTELTRWRKFANKDLTVVWHDSKRVADSTQSTIPIAHGSFDNDIEVIGRTIARITGVKNASKLKHPVVDLRFF